MANLIINVRCTCEEEFLLLHKLHKLYQEDQLRKRLKERLVAAQGNGDGTVTETVERTFVPQAVDGGIDALGNPPLPESNPATEPTHFAFEEEPVPDDMWKEPLPMEERLCEQHRAEVTLADVLEAEALEKAEAEDEGWNGGDHNFCA